MLLRPKYCNAPISPWFLRGMPLPLTWHLNSALRSKTFFGSGWPSARWQAPSALKTKLTTSVSGPIVVGRPIAQLVAPQPRGLPGAQIVKHPADHIRPFSWSRNEFEVLQDDASEWKISPGHGRPISAPAYDQVLSISRPLSRNARRKILAGLISGQFGSPNRSAGAGKLL